MPTYEETMQTIKAGQQATWIECNMTPELEAVVARGYSFRGRDPESYWNYCRLFDRVNIWISPFRDTFQVKMFAQETMKPTRNTSTRIGKLRKEWSIRLYGRDDRMAWTGREADAARLTEDQATELAGALWAIVGQPDAYVYAEPPDEEDDE